MKGTLWAIGLLLSGLAAASLAASTSELEARLQHKLMAPCCYGGTVDRHDSAAANQMKTEIHELVLSGRTERQILDYYKARYGTRILAEPEGSTWWIGTLTPILALVVGTFTVTRVVRKWTRPVACDRSV
jgi:cytochrome c-type biogenesis protein CcmH